MKERSDQCRVPSHQPLLYAGALLASLFGAASAVWAQAPALEQHSPAGALELLDRCVNFAPDEATGLELLERECPGLEAAIESSGYAAFISDRQREGLTAAALDDLYAVLERDSGRIAPVQAPDMGALEPILASLEEEQARERPLTWFERLKRWLRERFTQQEAADSWLTRWLERIEIRPSAVETIVYASIMLVILLALVVIANELRAAGVFRLSGNRARTRGEGSVVEGAPADIADLDSAPVAERPSLLLRMLVAALVRNGRLSTERSLTHRELVGRAQLHDEAERLCFQRVATLAEQVVYGRGASSLELEPVISAGRELHARWSRVAQ